MRQAGAVSIEPTLHAVHDPATGAVAYAVIDRASGAAVAIDPVLDFDPRRGRIGTATVERLLRAIRDDGATLAWVLETHVHADHLTAAGWLAEQTGARIAIGSGVAAAERQFAPVYGLDGPSRAFDRLLADGDRLAVGGLDIEVIATPGHTPDSLSYRIGDRAFVGDALFMPDAGSGRCDFPGGDALALYASSRRLLALPDQTRLLVGHDYGPGRPPAWETTVAASRAANIHLRDGIAAESFAAMRRARDATLEPPLLMVWALQVNLCAGRLPAADAGGVRRLALPLDRF